MNIYFILDLVLFLLQSSLSLYQMSLFICSTTSNKL